MHAPTVFSAMALLLALAAPAAVDAASPASGAPPGWIVFSRAQLNADGTQRSSSLWLATPATAARRLTPLADHEYNASGSWSPRGTRIAFQHGSMAANGTDRFDIFSVDPLGHQLLQLTSGSGNFVTPAWGPGNRIALVSKYRHHDCLSIVEADGHHQHDLFCPPSPAEVARPVWSADGRSIFIHAGYYTGSLEPFWRSLAYRVDARTGAPFVLTDRVLDEPRFLEFSPDGSRGIYSDVWTNAMQLIDFNTGRLKSLGRGYAPRWSSNGSRIAFTREVFDFSQPQFHYYEPLFVMDADGSHVRRVTQSRIDNHAYTAAQWSADGVHVLVNRRVYLDPSLTITRHSMRIVNVDTRVVTPVADGYAEPGAWFER
ncbi:TolB family protein [Cognatiluteimonas profundi]|uniref:TolB family protein n=1 Tax=Cognatiluteimonas profundi TaxID=2594501 RepID=UPI00131C8D97|nr:PD40 domain-containing protein [Lysobacter profundi]